jgi:hypothetical protein
MLSVSNIQAKPAPTSLIITSRDGVRGDRRPLFPDRFSRWAMQERSYERRSCAP